LQQPLMVSINPTELALWVFIQPGRR
jgi:hypothetical protein